VSAARASLALVETVLAVATGRVRHDYEGLCPDDVNGPDARDGMCKACNLLVDAERAVREAQP
jgi:hypothetical protein